MSESKKCQNCFFPFLPASSKTSVWLRAPPHSSDANGRRNVELFFVRRGGRAEEGEGVQDHDGFTNTRVDTQRTEILPGHLLRKSHILLSQDLHFLSGPGWVSELLIAAVTTKWSSCESGNQLPRRVFAPPHLSSACLTLWNLCVCVFADTAHHLLPGFGDSEPTVDPTAHVNCEVIPKNPSHVNVFLCLSINGSSKCTVNNLSFTFASLQRTEKHAQIISHGKMAIKHTNVCFLAQTSTF